MMAPVPPPTPPPLQPVLVIGNISCVASVLLFGLAGTYWQAMAARAGGGALNAIILVEKAMIGRSGFILQGVMGRVCQRWQRAANSDTRVTIDAAFGTTSCTTFSWSTPLSLLFELCCFFTVRPCLPPPAGEGLESKDSQAKAFGLLALCWGLGSLAGPLVGGALSAPCTTGLRVEALCGGGSLLVLR